VALAKNGFVNDPIAKVLLRTVLPIVLLTSINGLLTVIDAVLLGAFVGPEALAAVTLMFPMSMLLVALSTMVASGMASIVARHLGAGLVEKANRTFAGAHWLSLLICLVLVGLFLVCGASLIVAMAGSAQLAAMGYQFLMISVLTSPAMFLVSIHSDALRIEGKIGFMALAGLLVALGNIGFNIVLIAGFNFGVAGSAGGTALAQALALAVMLTFRLRRKAILAIPAMDLQHWRTGWGEILALGAPRSLSFMGIALGSAATILAVKLHISSNQEDVIAAYGAVMRMMTFAYLPLLGLSLGMQAVVGNNFGAGLESRAEAALKLTLLCALGYCVVIELALLVFRDSLGGLFVSDAAVRQEAGRILPFYAVLYFTMGPMMMISSYLQSIGDARRSAFLALARPYLFAVPLTFALPPLLGEVGIWTALPAADLLLVVATAATLLQRSRLRTVGSPSAA
jgi:putative MATE family efflux protein